MTRIAWALLLASAAQAAPAPLYYQDPDGKPAYAAVPARTADGRAFRPVFEDVPAPPPAAALPAPAAKTAASAEHTVLYYRNPMGLPDTSPTPKKDSMGMDYQPVYADDAAAGDAPGTVRITPGRLQTLGVRTELASMRPAAARTIRATGVLQFDERRMVTITTRVPGFVERLVVTATGDTVRRGQTLAELYSPDLVAAEDEFVVASGMGAEMVSASVRRLRALNVPEPEIARLQRTRKPARRIAVVAEADGVVTDKPVQQGMRVDAGEVLYRTADLSEIWLIAQVAEQDLGGVVPGRAAHASFVAFPGRVFDGRVDFVAPDLSADTRTARARIVMPNPDGTLRAGMFAAVTIEAAPAGAPVLTIPNSAVLDNGSRQVVLVAEGEGKFVPRTVRLGARGDDTVAVLDGLRDGDRVVVGANFLIDAESNLRTALQAFGTGDKP